jgi:hypothetical protein
MSKSDGTVYGDQLEQSKRLIAMVAVKRRGTILLD